LQPWLQKIGLQALRLDQKGCDFSQPFCFWVHTHGETVLKCVRPSGSSDWSPTWILDRRHHRRVRHHHRVRGRRRPVRNLHRRRRAHDHQQTILDQTIVD
jgi:hypothetical protein